MLREYHEAVETLTDVEKILFKSEINKLNMHLQPGYDSLNLSSLGIPNFIKKAQDAIGAFREIKKKVQGYSGTIEEFVQKIEEA